ncbi:lipopolysaccharide biosynthesis protein [Hymenobacter endophyticus]|uniref:Lipopolysaccharide biosynthesis protein n=1 Tax=Hymenobacter endophyticus TaxID=3076335 RepID=A0ABU3TCR0_9BACT|nr:lipopolysaccharide biosynthesis protein [Hymenobacter endophyticus]MDU0369157.1 lipopolysaccharide biosynthesis protein [Hymenobacter endophyticus]
MASTASNLTTAAVHGVKWTTGATITTALLQIGYTATMARLLSPAAFGLVALAGVILRFGSYFAQMGMEQAIIQKAELTRADVRAAFTSSVVLSLVFAALLVAAAPLAASIVQQPEVVPVVRVLAAGLLLTGLNATALSLLRRHMQFRTLAIIEVVSYVLGYGGLGIGLALHGYGVWSLVAATLGQSLLLTILSYLAERHDIRPLFEWETYRPLVAYGSRMSAISFLEFVTGSLDTLLIGRLLGAAALGIYSRGWMLIGLPVYLLTTSVSKVVFPSFSQVQADRPRLRAVYLSSITLVGALVIPICAGAAVAAPEIVRVMLGPDWLAAVPILRVVCAAFALSMVTMFAGVVCDATATLTPKLWLNLLYVVLLTGLFMGLSRYGLLGVAGAVVAGEVLRTVLYLGLMRRVLQVSATDVLSTYVPGLLAGVLVAAGIAGVRELLPPGSVPAAALLLTEILTGGLLLLAFAVGTPPAQLRHVLRRILQRLLEGNAASGRFGHLLLAFSARLAHLDNEPVATPVVSSAPVRPHPALFPDPETELV